MMTDDTMITLRQQGADGLRHREPTLAQAPERRHLLGVGHGLRDLGPHGIAIMDFVKAYNAKT